MSDLSYVRNNDGSYSKLVQLSGSNVQQPVDIQSRLQTTIQTHNAVSVGASGTSYGSWIDVNGYDKVGITMITGTPAANGVHVQWSNDGSTLHGSDYGAIPNATRSDGAIEVTVKARYVRVALVNYHTASVTMSAWAYLKC